MCADDVEIESFTAIRSEGDALAVGRPRRLSLHAGCLGELTPVPPIRLHRPDAIDHDEREVFAVGGPGGIAHAGRPGLRARAQRQDRDECEDDVEAGLQTRLECAQVRLPSVTASTMWRAEMP